MSDHCDALFSRNRTLIFFRVFIGSNEFTKSRFFVLSVVYRWLMSNFFIMVCFQIIPGLYERIKM